MCQGNAAAQLKVRVLGSENASVNLVLLHGWGMNSGAFDRWLPQLVDDYRITLIDLPGFGVNNAVLPELYTLEQVSECIETVLPDNSVLVGWSLGGLVAQHIAAFGSCELKGLVTVASTPYFVQEQAWAGIRQDILAMFATQLSRSYDKTLERFLAIQAMGSDNPRQEVRDLKGQIKQYPDPSPTALAAGLDLLAEGDVRHALSKIKVPTLRLYGRRDTLVPVSAVDAIHALHPQSDNVVLCQAAHAPFMSHPEKTTQVLHQFVSQINGING
jgi:pimeloyl-[acyl-carrier protein] methyl ester esterase